MTEATHQRWTVRLLAANLAVLCILAVGMLATALSLRQRARETGVEIGEREASTARALIARSRQTAAAAEDLERRRRSLDPIPSGPSDKMNHAIRLMQLMVDEQLVILQHVAGTQEVLARAAAIASTAPEARPPRARRR
jgi:hypothetical protein